MNFTETEKFEIQNLTDERLKLRNRISEIDNRLDEIRKYPDYVNINGKILRHIECGSYGIDPSSCFDCDLRYYNTDLKVAFITFNTQLAMYEVATEATKEEYDYFIESKAWEQYICL